jgi:hypothetical protein
MLTYDQFESCSTAATVLQWISFVILVVLLIPRINLSDQYKMWLGVLAALLLLTSAILCSLIVDFNNQNDKLIAAAEAAIPNIIIK